MADNKAKEEKDNKAAESQAVDAGKKSELIKYIIFGLVGLIAVVGIAFGTLMFLGGENSANVNDITHEEIDHEQSTDKKHSGNSDESHNAHQANKIDNDSEDGVPDHAEDSILALLEQDESFLENLMDNLAVLDYVPAESELGMDDEESGNSKEDSIESMNWLDKEKAALTKRENELSLRKKTLDALESKLSKQIIRIEQAESNRIAKLAKLYDGMDSRAIAKLMANLDDATIVSILPRMKLKNASSVMSLMPSKRAARLSKQMITIAEK